jgi:uncharacterized repeat protein (TIGR03803 family)
VVFSLAPRPFGRLPWKEIVLHRLQGSDGFGGGLTGLLRDPKTGALYGMAPQGGIGCGRFGCGTAFSLAPPVKGKPGWAFTLLHSFAGGSDGASPTGALVFGPKGALIGVTQFGAGGGCGTESPNELGCGTVFKLTPPSRGSTKWTETVLFRFHGTVAGAWPQGIIVGRSGSSLIGTAMIRAGFGSAYCKRSNGCGAVFGLVPPPSGKGLWSEGILHAFDTSAQFPDGSRPAAPVFQDSSGNLFGTTGSGGPYDVGTVFKLTPVAAQGQPWPETQLYTFTNGADGGGPLANVISGPDGVLFGTTANGGNMDCHEGCGVVFMLTP